MEGKIEFVFSEFGPERKNYGGVDLSRFGRLDPSYSSFKKHFPQASFRLYTDNADLEVEGVKKTLVIPPAELQPEHPRFYVRCSLFYKFYGMLQSKSAVVIGLDSDLIAVSETVRQLVPLTEKFGVCFPANPRFENLVDLKIGLDPGSLDDCGPIKYGSAVNSAIVSLDTTNKSGRQLIKSVADNYLRHPSRTNTVVARAMWETGISPYILPFPWCVCRDHVRHKHLVGNEIVLHAGHREVYDYFINNFFVSF